MAAVDWRGAAELACRTMLGSMRRQVPLLRSWVVEGADWTAYSRPAAKTGSLDDGKVGRHARPTQRGCGLKTTDNLLRASEDPADASDTKADETRPQVLTKKATTMFDDNACLFREVRSGHFRRCARSSGPAR